jgi:hypothetical protein
MSKCETICSIFRAFETASFGRLRGKLGTQHVWAALLHIWESRLGEIQATSGGAFATVPPEEGIVAEQKVESAVNNE